MRFPHPSHRALAALILTIILSAGCASAYAAPELTPTPALVVQTSTSVPTRANTAAPEPVQPTTAPTQTPTATPSPTNVPSVTLTPGYVRISAGRVIAPILMYHHISDQGNTQYITSTAAFRSQMKALHEAGYQTINIAHLAQVIRGGGELPEKPVILSFDDGYLDVYENAFPILQEYGFTGVAYIITSTLEKGKTYGYMQVEELQALVDAGWEIGSHTVSHANLKTAPAGFNDEVNGSWQDLEEQLLVPIRTFSYPFASANPWIEDQVAKAGYDSAVGVGTFVSHSEKTLYYLSRREVARGITKQAFLNLLVPSEGEILFVTQSASTVTPTP